MSCLALCPLSLSLKMMKMNGSHCDLSMGDMDGMDGMGGMGGMGKVQYVMQYVHYSFYHDHFEDVLPF